MTEFLITGAVTIAYAGGLVPVNGVLHGILMATAVGTVSIMGAALAYATVVGQAVTIPPVFVHAQTVVAVAGGTLVGAYLSSS